MTREPFRTLAQTQKIQPASLVSHPNRLLLDPLQKQIRSMNLHVPMEQAQTLQNVCAMGSFPYPPVALQVPMAYRGTVRDHLSEPESYRSEHPDALAMHECCRHDQRSQNAEF